MSDENENKEGKELTISSRWWEYYFVRYFIGTIVGAASIIALLNFSPIFQAESFKSLLSNVNLEHITVLGTLGLAYCYLASAPMLTIHATRAYIDWDGKSISGESFCRFALILITVSVLLSIPYLGNASIDWIFNSADFVPIFLISIVLTFQFYQLGVAYHDSFKKLIDFYLAMTKNRASTSPFIKEYVVSYRHMREHGNAFAIIFFEVCLTIVLISARDIRVFAGLIFFWVVPAALVWFIATVLENRIPENA